MLDNTRQQYILSFTSYGKRLTTHAPIAAASLLNQTRPPDKIILWIGHSETIPEEIKELQNKGLEVRYCIDIKSYTKLVPALRAFPEANIITADDDMIYPSDWFDKLYQAHLSHPGAIVCHRAHEITLSDKGNILPYLRWRHNIADVEHVSNIFPTGVGGVLYPPGSLHKIATDEEAFLQLAPFADDTWFWAAGKLNNSKHVVVENGYADTHELAITPEDNEGLWTTINSFGGNDNAIKRILHYYPEVLNYLR